MKTNWRALSIMSITLFAIVMMFVSNAYASTLYVDCKGILPDSHKKIQYAIDNSTNGDYIYVLSCTYYENLFIINKSIEIEGADRDSTIIDGSGKGDVIYVTANNVSIKNFNIRNSSISIFDAGIKLFNSYNSILENNNVSNNRNGIFLVHSNNNTITKNKVAFNKFGIVLSEESNQNIVKNNSILYNDDTGINIDSSSNNNKIYHNNFINNTIQASDYGSNNLWDNGYPSGGNYWSNHKVKGNPSNGSLPYDIPINGVDHYPFEYPLWTPIVCFNYSIKEPPTDRRVEFDASCSHDIDGIITKYMWDFGDDTNGTGENVLHQYNKSGIYTVKLTVIDNDNLVDELSNSTTQIITLPAISIDSARVNENENVTVQIYLAYAMNVSGLLSLYLIYNPSIVWVLNVTVNSSLSENTSIDSDINNQSGTTLIMMKFINPIDTKNTTPIINIILHGKNNGTSYLNLENVKLFNDNITNITNGTIKVTVPPVACFNYLPASSMASGSKVEFNASCSYDRDGNITSYNWTFDDNAMDLDNNVTTIHQYTKSGNYTVNLTVIDDDGLTNKTTQNITVLAPKVSVGSASVRPNKSVSVQINLANATNVFNLSMNLTYDPNIVNIIECKVNSSLPKNTKINYTIDSINGITSINLSSSSDDTINATINTPVIDVTFKGMSIGFSYLNLTKVNITYNNSESHPVTNITNGTIEVIILPPIANFTYTPKSPTIDRAVLFNASNSTDPDGNITEYIWNFGDGTNGTGKIVEHNYTTQGNYTINLTVIDDDGLNNSTKRDIIVSVLVVSINSTCVNISSPNIKYNETVQINIANATDVVELRMNLTYDPSIVNITKVEKNSSLPENTTINYTIDYINGIISIFLSSNDTIDAITNKPVIEVMLIGKINVTSNMNLMNMKITYYPNNESNVTNVRLINGTINVVLPKTGNIDGYGDVDFNDVIYLTKYYYGFVEIIYAYPDVDCSGALDFNDIIYLAKYIYGFVEKLYPSCMYFQCSI